MRLSFRFSGSPKTPWSTRVVKVLSANLSVGFFSFVTFFDIVSQNLQKQYYIMNVFYHKKLHELMIHAVLNDIFLLSSYFSRRKR